MKKIFTVMAISIVSVFATANKSAETAETARNSMVYYVVGCSEYHTSAYSAHIHSGSGKIMMQRESGCKGSMHKCMLCKGAELINNCIK